MDSHSSLLGDTLADRYEIRRLVGRGKTGSVYAALDREARRKVAIKVLHPQLCGLDEHLRRFEREFEVTRRIDNPHTVQMYEFGDTGAHRFLVMEFLEGKRLDSLIEAKGKLPVRQVCRLAMQIAEALAAAHAKGVIHRDLNPSNIMLIKGARTDAEGREHIKVLDFGLSRLLDNQEELTGFGVRLGSARYMSPEYIESSQLDHRSDLYALGCIVFQMLTGQPPFIGPSMKVLNSHTSTPAPAPSSQTPGLPEWLDSLVLKLLDKSPDARPTLDEAIAAFRRHLDEQTPSSEDPQTLTMERQAASVITTGLGHRGALPGHARSRTGRKELRYLALGLQLALILLLLLASAVVAAAITWMVIGAG